MTSLEIKRLRPGHFVQEILGSAHGGRFAKWGRPRRVVEILRRWKTTPNRARAGKACVCFSVDEGIEAITRYLGL